jgi:chromosome segregation ATPase
MPDELSDDDKTALHEALRGSALTDREIQVLASGGDEAGYVEPVDSPEDLITAAAHALEFVESLDTPESVAEVASEQEAVSGFDALLRKLENLRADISSLQRGVVGVFAAQLLTFRGKVVELKSRISDEMVTRLKMQFFKSFIESTFVDIVDSEFAALEKDLVDKIVEQTQERFKEFAARVRESEVDLRGTIVEQQNIVRSFMQTLEEEATNTREKLVDKDTEIHALEQTIQNLQSQVDAELTSGSAIDELNRKIAELEDQISTLKEEIFRKDGVVEARTTEAEKARSETEEIRSKLTEVESAFEVFKTEKAMEKPVPLKSDAEIQALESKVALLETAVAEKREEAEQYSAKIPDLERQLHDAVKDKEAAETEATKRLEELDSLQSKLKEVKDLEEKLYSTEGQLKEAQDKIPIVEMQREAFEKATRLMEKERDMALEMRDLARQRTQRYIKVIGMDNDTKVLLLVDEVGSMTFKELGKALGIPIGLATKYARALEKLGVLKVDEKKAYSTLKDVEIEEGEVVIDLDSSSKSD